MPTRALLAASRAQGCDGGRDETQPGRARVSERTTARGPAPLNREEPVAPDRGVDGRHAEKESTPCSHSRSTSGCP